ncbi:MAG: PDZ domain-containing protein, partial [Pirellulaceae bacterium]|nr:PDZ domain-containing protein [Pirellulaceae bacterium]
MVIFVHELGHFAVAKLCGVKCEKFYLGFDIAGWKICKFKWGETEYGIGAVPLGGYVKMLGQEDNPARLKEEIERAKAARDLGQAAAEGQPGDLAAAEAALYDPRSYLAQSVPKRMAIISAGVIMNLIFAFFAAVVAYSLGVKEPPCEVGAVEPGYPAWQHNLKPGDRMVEINGEPTRRFRDLQMRIPLSKKGVGATIRVERPGVDEPIDFTIHPSRKNVVAAIGAAGPRDATLLTSAGWLNNERLKPYVRNTVVARAEPGFALGDKIVEIDGVAVTGGPQLREMLSARRDKPIRVAVERTKDGGKTSERLTMTVAPRPMRRVGMVMKMGPVFAVQDDSPAARAGIEAGDLIAAIDGEPLGDPMTLADRLWAKVNAAVADGQAPPTVLVTVKRPPKVENEEGAKKREEQTLEIRIELKKTDDYESPFFRYGFVSVPSLGLAYDVLPEVEEVLPDSPAAKAGVKPGDVVSEVTLVPPSEDELKKEGLTVRDVLKESFAFDGKTLSWPSFVAMIQDVTLPGSKIEFQITSGKDEKTVSLESVEASDRFNPDRGFVFHPTEIDVTAKKFGDALRLGGEETLLQATLVLRFLRGISTGDVSPRGLGGPISIAQMAAAMVMEGVPEFLLFLTMISTTLAVINFLPIPVLDGGHFVFLLYEGIRGKPADERIQLGLSYLGLLLILALMVWVLGLDFKLIPRQ